MDNEQMGKINIDDVETKNMSNLRRWMMRILKFFLCVIILGAGVAAAAYIVKTSPRPESRPSVKEVPIVQVQEIHCSTEQVVIEAMGTVEPAQIVELKSRVSGAIVYIHPEFTEGGFVQKGIELLRIDPEDYKLAIIQKQSQVASAECELKVEMGHQEIAKREWELLNSGGKTLEDTELALRKPNLEKAQANLASARADLNDAELDLYRTSLYAPFNGVIRIKNVDIGSQISTQDQLAEIIGTDEFRVRVSLPMDRLQWIHIPDKEGEPGSKVRIFYGSSTSEHFIQGEIIKLLPDIENEGLMALILVSVRDPFSLESKGKKQFPLLAGEYVRVEILGKKLEDIVRIPRSALRDNSEIWILDKDKKLEIRKVDPVWRGKQDVLIKNGIDKGVRLIISNINIPVQGMDLRLEGEAASTSTGHDEAPGLSPLGLGDGSDPQESFINKFDTDKDGFVSKQEFNGPPMMFKIFDKDDDGYIKKDEAPDGLPPQDGLPSGFPNG